MNRRLQQFLSAENISQTQFAESIGVAKASVSHILAGRNKPGFDFILSMARIYPNLNLDWLIAGRGRMYKSSPVTPPEAGIPDEIPPAGAIPDSGEDTLFPPEGENADNQSTSPRITKVVIFFDNGTFQELG